ncbi:MAG: enoyl-CoA hydratase/isomerase family protein [Acidimicrobiales bacterium]
MTAAPGPRDVLEVRQAIESLERRLLFQRLDPMEGTPVLFVAVGAGDDLARLASLTRDLPCVAVGLAADEPAAGSDAALDAFDVLIAPGAAVPPPWVGSPDLARTAALLADAVEASPHASVALVQLLRCNQQMSVADAIVAESFVYSMLQSGPRFGQWLSSRGPSVPAPPAQEPPVALTRHGPTLEVELNRPSVRNAVNMEMRVALIDALRTAAVDPSIEQVRLSGRGPDFCSGGDLSEFGLAADPATAHLVRIDHSVGSWVHRSRARVTVDVHGASVGAGVEIAAFSPHVRATADAVFSLPEVGMGLVPGAGGTASVSRRTGRHRACYLALSGAAVSAATALQWGLIDEVTS